jgi:DNA ligase-1
LSEQDASEVVKYIRYNIYDLWDDANPDMCFSERNELINTLFNNVPFVDIVPTSEVDSDDSVEHYFEYFTALGYEGLILRKDAAYEHKRSKNLLKYKKFMDAEFEILDICEGKIKGYAEYAWVLLDNKLTCKATFSFTDEKCIDILQRKDELIGKQATVEFFGYTSDGKLRFPILKSIRDYE